MIIAVFPAIFIVHTFLIIVDHLFEMKFLKIIPQYERNTLNFITYRAWLQARSMLPYTVQRIQQMLEPLLKLRGERMVIAVKLDGGTFSLYFCVVPKVIEKRISVAHHD